MTCRIRLYDMQCVLRKSINPFDHGCAGTNEFAEKGLQVETPMDQLAPGGYLHFLWDMDSRAPSPTGSWSTSPPHEAEGKFASFWDLCVASLHIC